MSEETIKPGEWEKLYDFVEKTIPLPGWIKITIASLVLAALVAVILAVLVKTCSLILELWAEKIYPRFSSAEKRQRALVRRLFAHHLRGEIETRNRLENWRDEEFAELEAEVEAEGGHQWPIPFVRRSSGVRRESSLAAALQKSADQLVLVEGEPGSGKSVALRHVAYQLADKASYARHLDTKLPVYVNLKELVRTSEQVIDRDLIRDFVFKSLNRVNDRSVTEFLEINFDEGVRAGLWVFLFDSFDEIPDVLSSTEADQTVLAYSNAISDFFSGLNACRGVVASREYRGPARQGWRVFRVLELSSARQNRLIRLAFMNYPTRIEDLQSGLSAATDDVRSMARNPMLLGLLCEHVRLGHAFPQTTYEVFSKYIEYRFVKDSHRIAERHGIETGQVRDIAEKIAFTMTADPSLGLNPKRAEVLPALLGQGFHITRTRLVRVFNALEYMKIGRADSAASHEEDRDFTFAHRRFQEYFATAIVIADPSRVPPSSLLFDARWRETAVVLCQTGEPPHVEPIIAEASRFLTDSLAGLASDESARGEPFPWSAGMIHMLGILQAGLSRVSDSATTLVRDQAGEVVGLAFNHGDFLDKKYALELSGIAPEPTLSRLVNQALDLDSEWLIDIIFRQISKLSAITPGIIGWIRRSLLRMSLSGRFVRDGASIRAYIARLPNSNEMQRVASFAAWLPTLDSLCSIIILISLCIFLYHSTWFYSVISAAVVLLVANRLVAFSIAAEETFLGLSGIYFMLWPFLFSLIPGPLSLSERILATVAVYLSFWTSCSIHCILRGEGTNLFLWPFTPFFFSRDFLAETIRAPLNFLGSGFKQMIYNFKRNMIPLALGIAIIGLISAGVYGFDHFLSVRYISYTIGSLLGLTGTCFFAKYCMDHIRDRLDLRKWRVEIAAPATVESIVAQYHRLRIGSNKQSLLREVRLHGSLSSTPNGETVLRRLAVSIGDDSGQRDEIYRLIEQLVSHRMSRFPSEVPAKQQADVSLDANVAPRAS